MAYALDEWLLDLGLWRDKFMDVLPGGLRGKSLHALSAEDRRTVLDNIDFSQPFYFAAGDFDETGYRIGTLDSTTTYDPETGVLESEIRYWRHFPYDNEDGDEEQIQSVFYARATRDPLQPASEIPVLIPDVITIDGNPVYSERGENPHRPKNRKMIAGTIDLAGQINRLIPGWLLDSKGKPQKVRDAKKVLGGRLQSADEKAKEDLLAQLTGKSAFLSGLNKKGGFAPALNQHFIDTAYGEGIPIRFTTCTREQLKIIMGFTPNTLDRDLDHSRNRVATGVKNGIRYRSEVRHDIDPVTGNDVFVIVAAPWDPPAGEPVPPEIEISRIEFTQKKVDSFDLVSASILQQDPKNFSKYTDRMDILGFFQTANRDYFGRGLYPPFADLFARHHLHEHVPAIVRRPSYLHVDGGELLHISLFGSGTEKKVGPYGDEVGNCHLFLSRGLRPDGSLSECATLVDLALATGKTDTDIDGILADPTAYLEALRNGGGIVLTHTHYDHDTIEYYIQKGWFKNMKIRCTERLRQDIEYCMDRLKVDPRDRPVFETFSGTQSIPVYDADGNIRQYIQVCEDGSLHSAPTTMAGITGCFNNKHWKKPYFLASDNITFTERGWDFAKRMPFILAEQIGIAIEEMWSVLHDRDGNPDYYISLDELTGIKSGGYAPKPKDFRKTVEGCALLDKELKLIDVTVPFSTNELELEIKQKINALEDFFRNSVFIGASLEQRRAVLNRHGVERDLDLATVEVPKEKLPQAAFDAALEGVQKELSRLEKRVESGRASDEDEANYEFCRAVHEEVLYEKERGESRPVILFQTFLSGNDPDNAPPEECSARLAVRAALRRTTKAYREALSERLDPRLHKADTAYYMLRRLSDSGRVDFKKLTGLNAHSMHEAIMAGQDRAALNAGRTSALAKFLRDYAPHELLIYCTGPMGIAEEKFASLFKFAWFRSLMDLDERVRSTAFELDSENIIINITQPPPPNKYAQMAQDALLRMIAENRNVTIRVAIRGGFKIVNPKSHAAAHERHYRNLGWDVTPYSSASNEIVVNGTPFHIHGHGFYNDIRETCAALPCRNHIPIHTPDRVSFRMHKEMIEAMPGKSHPIAEPKDHISRRAEMDPQTGRWTVKEIDHVQESFYAFRKTGQYGKFANEMIELIRVLIFNGGGIGEADALNVRTAGDGIYFEKTASTAFNDLTVPGKNIPGARQQMMGPSPAEYMQVPDTVSRGAGPVRTAPTRKQMRELGLV